MTTDVINGVPRELKPCPFCGGKADPTGWMRGDGVQGPECDNCGATAASAEDWNKRATAQPAADGEREAFDEWFRAQKGLNDSVDTTFIDAAFFPYRAFKFGIEYAAQPQQAVSNSKAKVRMPCRLHDVEEETDFPPNFARGYNQALEDVLWLNAEPRQAVAVTDEVRRLREALSDAAQSLETISNGAGLDEFMKDASDVRGYARSRASVARAAHKTGEEECSK